MIGKNTYYISLTEVAENTEFVSHREVFYFILIMPTGKRFVLQIVRINMKTHHFSCLTIRPYLIRL